MPLTLDNNIELIDEEEAFQSYRQQHTDRQNNLNSQKRSRYSATLERTSAGLCGGNMSSPLSGDGLSDDSRSRENERLRGIKSNFSRLVSLMILLETYACSIEQPLDTGFPIFGLFLTFVRNIILLILL